MRGSLFPLLLVVFTVSGFAQESAQPSAAPLPPRSLRVLVKEAKPFVFQQNGAWEGFAVEVWNRVANEAGMRFEIQKAETVPEVVERLRKGEADVGVGALSITAERETIIDFSHKFYDSGLQILVRKQGGGGAWTAFRKVIGEVLTVAGVLLIALLVNSHILWFFERKRNPESFPENYAAGVWEAIWWSVCTLITGGCENKAPLGVAGRLFAIVWMLAGIGLVAFVTARMATVMTVETLTSDIRTLADLREKEVGTVGGEAAERYLARHPVVVKGFADLDATCRALAEGKVRAVVYDAPLLRYYINEHPNLHLTLVGDIFEDDSYGFALQQASPIRKEVNRALLKISEEGFLRELNRKWFASGEEK